MATVIPAVLATGFRFEALSNQASAALAGVRLNCGEHPAASDTWFYVGFPVRLPAGVAWAAVVVFASRHLARHTRTHGSTFLCKRKGSFTGVSTDVLVLAHRRALRAVGLGANSAEQTSVEEQTALVNVDFETGEPEALMDFLLDLGACAASVCAADPGPDGEDPSLEVMRAAPGDRVPLWRRSIVTAMFDRDVELDTISKAVQTAFDLPALPLLRPKPVESKDWITHVQQLWEPLPLGKGFEVRLPWHEGPAGGMFTAEKRMVMRLEGGAAFGLGDHPTTQGAVAFLEREVPACGPNCQVLDYGTGSGVLAFCALMLGSSSAVGVDVDARSISSARRSVALNILPESSTQSIEFHQSPLGISDAECFAASLVQQTGLFDVVVANILCRPLVELALVLACTAKPGGWLALTGLRSNLGDPQAIQVAYGDAFEDFHEVQLEGGWVLMEARRRRCLTESVGT